MAVFLVQLQEQEEGKVRWCTDFVFLVTRLHVCRHL